MFLFFFNEVPLNHIATLKKEKQKEKQKKKEANDNKVGPLPCYNLFTSPCRQSFWGNRWVISHLDRTYESYINLQVD